MKTLLLGDMSPTDVTNPLFLHEDVESLFSDTASLFEGNDVNFVNLECALTDHDKSIMKYGPPLKATIKVADTLKLLGVNYCGLSNNHIFDYGVQGAIDTMGALDRAGIGYTGFGMDYHDSRKNLVIQKANERLEIIAVCEHEYSYALEDRMGSRPYDEYDTMDDIRNAKEISDRVIVIYHGGKEYCQYPSPRLRRLCRAMVRNGADVVLCQHSHCVGCYEQYEGSHILYGQGNFHFVKPSFLKKELEAIWNTSLAVRYDTKSHEIEFIPLTVKDNGITIAKNGEKEGVLSEFEERNSQLASGEWKRGWAEFCEGVKGNYMNALINAFKPDATDREQGVFGHHLDCEAHTDVWREIFPTANMTNEKNI